MGTRRSVTQPGTFALAVREEVLAELGRRGLNSYSLSKLIDRGATYLQERIKSANKELTLNDIELICTTLGVDINVLMGRAVAVYEARTADELNVSDLSEKVTEEDLKEDFDLAAHPDDGDEEVDYESYN